jgi:hypothetical protein
MDEFLQGRSNEEAYTVFFERFMPCATRKTSWDQRIAMATSGGGSICTSSDEAFALLLLENSYDRWLDIFTNCPGAVMQRRGEKKRVFESDTPTLYTRGGIKYEKTRLAQSVKGWSGTGIRRYNVLFQKVKEDRASNPDFESNWLAEKKRAQAEMLVTPKKRRWDDDDLAHSDIFGSDHENRNRQTTDEEGPVEESESDSESDDDN